MSCDQGFQKLMWIFLEWSLGRQPWPWEILNYINFIIIIIIIFSWLFVVCKMAMWAQNGAHMCY